MNAFDKNPKPTFIVLQNYEELWLIASDQCSILYGSYYD